MKTILTIEEIRLANLAILKKEFYSFEVIAKKSKTAASYLSQIHIRSRVSNSEKIRDMGPKLARKLEKGCGKPVGWMDVDHSSIDEGEIELRKIYESMDSELRDLLLHQARRLAKIDLKQ